MCGTGISQETYRDAVRNELSMNWLCVSCRNEDWVYETEQLTLATSHNINSSTISFIPDAKSTPINSLSISKSPMPTSNDIIHSTSQQSSHSIGTLNNTGSLLNSSGNSFNMGIIHTSLYSQEDSLNYDDAVNALLSENKQIEYEIVRTGSQRGKPTLIDCRGYSFTIKVMEKNVIRWTCTTRSMPNNCKATVSQTGNTFIPGELFTIIDLL